LGRDSGGDGGSINDPIVAATVNGRPIYIEDVRSHAVARGLLQEGEDLDANSDAFFFALEELIQFRLFAMEAEARGLDRQPHIRRQLENARERVLAAAIYDEIDERATDPEAIEQLYRSNAAQLGQGEEVRLRHIQFPTREAADAALRRLSQGERFEALAFELSTERNSAPDGGDMGFSNVSDLVPTVREAVQRANVGQLIGPLELGGAWHVFRLEDRRERGVPSLEELRPRIVNWLRFREISQLQERLERDARIERLRAQEQPAVEPGGEVSAPADAEQEQEDQPFRPDAGSTPGAAPPPFPFPMGPGGVTGAQAPPAAPAAPPAETPPAAPAPTPAPSGPPQ
jgi:peptidyl-prolyl cis-trans isomerase C